jgi:hypothetical protein
MYINIKEASATTGKSKGEIKNLIQRGLIDSKLENGHYVVNIDKIRTINTPPSNNTQNNNGKMTFKLSKKFTSELKKITNTKKLTPLKVTKKFNMATDWCHHNVETVVNERGGERIYVWIVTETFKNVVMSMFHSLWKDKNGNVFEVTNNISIYDPKKTMYFIDNKNEFKSRSINNVKYISSPSHLIDIGGELYSESRTGLEEYKGLRYIETIEPAPPY